MLMVQTLCGPLLTCLCFFSDSIQMSSLSTEFIDCCARQLGGKRLHVQFAWEQTQFDQFLTKKQKPIIKAPDWVDLPVPQAASSDLISRPTRLNRFNVKRHMSEVSWVASENRQLNLALQCWKVIILDSTSNTDLGSVLMHCIELGRSDDYIWQVVSDVFSKKATATLKSRASSLLAFGRWKRSFSVGNSDGIFPISEELAYQYLCELRVMKASPSKGKRFLEAVGFAKGLVGARVDEVLNSARVKGAASGAAAVAPKKKHPFSVEQLLTLERIAMFGSGQDAIFAGYVCFLVHCRLRWSDGQHCIQEPTLDVCDDRGFIEAALYHHKTANKRRSNVVRLLPVAGVLPGVSGYNWAECWLQNRLRMNMRGSMKQPMMPAPTADGSWTMHPLTSSEANIWLREILAPWSKTSIAGLATHSAKATVLSWMAKANVEISLRRLAGYHVTPGDKSALEYSRDAAAPVLRQIEAVYIAIRSETFKPDVPRSQRWSGAETLEEAVKMAANQFDRQGRKLSKRRMFNSSLLRLEAEPVLSREPEPSGDEKDWPGFDDETTLEDLRTHALKRSLLSKSHFDPDALSEISDMSESLESSTDADSGSDDAERQAEINAERNAKNLVAPSDLAGKVCFRHVKSHTLHFVERSLYDVKFFRCGRKCNSNYERVATVPAFAARGCMMCFGWSDTADEAASDPED